MAQENIKLTLSDGTEAEMLSYMTHGVARKSNAYLLEGQKISAGKDLDTENMQFELEGSRLAGYTDILVLGLLVKLGDKTRPNITADDIDLLTVEDFDKLADAAMSVQNGKNQPTKKA